MARALGEAGRLAMHHDDYKQAQSLLEQGRAVYEEVGDDTGVADILRHLGWIASIAGDPAGGVKLAKESVELARRSGDDLILSKALRLHSGILVEVGEYEDALLRASEALDASMRLGDSTEIGHNLATVAWVAVLQGDYERSMDVGERSLATLREAGHHGPEAGLLHTLGLAALGLGDIDRAHQTLLEGLTLSIAIEDRVNAAFCVDALAAVASEQGLPMVAARLLGWASAELEAIGAAGGSSWAFVSEVIERTRPAVDPQAWDAELAAGRSLRIEEVLDTVRRDLPAGSDPAPHT